MNINDVRNKTIVTSGGCWEWQGSRDEKGYGKSKVDGKSQRMHRVAYLLANYDIQDGLHVLHKCDNPSCCNPEHLFLGTAQDNMNDMVSKGRSCKGVTKNACETNGKAKLTQDQVSDIRSRYTEGGVTYRSLAALYQVSHVEISHIIKSKRW